VKELLDESTPEEWRLANAEAPNADRKRRANVREHCGRKRAMQMNLLRLKKLIAFSGHR